MVFDFLQKVANPRRFFENQDVTYLVNYNFL
jgi:hypothetical protein